VKKKWAIKGVIANFLEHVAELDCGVHKMTFWDLEGKQHTFDDYNEFRQYCKGTEAIQEILNKHHYYESAQSKDVAKAELLQVLRAIERGFMIQIPNNQKEFNENLLFPIQSYEDVGAITSLPSVTMFGKETTVIIEEDW